MEAGKENVTNDVVLHYPSHRLSLSGRGMVGEDHITQFRLCDFVSFAAKRCANYKVANPLTSKRIVHYILLIFPNHINTTDPILNARAL